MKVYLSVILVIAVSLMTYFLLAEVRFWPALSSNKRGEFDNGEFMAKSDKESLNTKSYSETTKLQQKDSVFQTSTNTERTEQETKELTEISKTEIMIKECVDAKADQKEKCQVTHDQLVELIKELESEDLINILTQIGRQRSEFARDYLWTVLAAFEGETGAKALREFYFNSPASTTASFYPLVRLRFREIATQNEVANVFDIYLKNDEVTTRRAYPLINLFNADKYLPVLKESFQQAEMSQKKNLFLIIANTNSKASFDVLQNILADDSNWNDDQELYFYLRGLNFVRTTDVRESMLAGISSKNRGVRLASYVVLQNFQDKEIILLTEALLQKEEVSSDPWAKITLDKARSTQRRKSGKARRR